MSYRRPFVISVAALALCMASCKNQPAEARRVEPVQHRVGTAPAPPHNPKELGWVKWHRNFGEASREAKARGLPLFVLFQEVPGCATCVGFGESVLSHPLLIEAIETAFVPVAIHNNKSGQDADVLAKFGEPSWNNPVVRFTNADGADLIPRADGVWSTHGIAERMVTALEAGGHAVPNYLRWAVSESAFSERATFSMHCYWSGEACLGDIPGVVKTRAGWLDGREVVEVDFDERQLTEADLKKLAADRGCGDFVANAKHADDASPPNQKYHLQRSRLRHLPLTPWQAARVNAALAKRRSPERWLSPRQVTLLTRVNAAQPAAFEGLERPADVVRLAAYEHTLRMRLSAR